MPKGNPKPVQTEEFVGKQFERADDTVEPLADKPTQVRLPVRVDAAIRALGTEKTAWLRRVIVKAAEQELMGEE